LLKKYDAIYDVIIQFLPSLSGYLTSAYMLPLPASSYSRPFCAAYIGYCISLVQTAQKPRPPPGRNHKVKIVARFLQIIHAALFCAALTRSIKGRCKAGTKKPSPGSVLNLPPKKNTATIPKGIIPKPCPASCRSGSGKGG
jgi:hypothetical protein